jgi:hypothetical protein
MNPEMTCKRSSRTDASAENGATATKQIKTLLAFFATTLTDRLKAQDKRALKGYIKVNSEFDFDLYFVLFLFFANLEMRNLQWAMINEQERSQTLSV